MQTETDLKCFVFVLHRKVLFFVSLGVFLYFNLSEIKHSQCISALVSLEILKSQRDLHDCDVDQI